MATEKQWLDAEKIWLMHRGGFAAARKDTTTKPEIGKLAIRLEQTGEVLNVDEDDVEKVCVVFFFLTQPVVRQGSNLLQFFYLWCIVNLDIRERYGNLQQFRVQNVHF